MARINAPACPGGDNEDHRIGGDRRADCCEVRTLVRETGEVVGTFGRNAGELHWMHNLAVDSKGNIYTPEVATGKRAQKFRPVAPGK